MKERYLGFLFVAIFAGYGVNLLIDQIHTRFFAMSLGFQSNWIFIFLVVPAALLLALAFGMGFFRKGGSRAYDLLVIVTVPAIIYLMLGAGYSCWHYCF